MAQKLVTVSQRAVSILLPVIICTRQFPTDLENSFTQHEDQGKSVIISRLKVPSHVLHIRYHVTQFAWLAVADRPCFCATLYNTVGDIGVQVSVHTARHYTSSCVTSGGVNLLYYCEVDWRGSGSWCTVAGRRWPCTAVRPSGCRPPRSWRRRLAARFCDGSPSWWPPRAGTAPPCRSLPAWLLTTTN